MTTRKTAPRNRDLADAPLWAESVYPLNLRSKRRFPMKQVTNQQPWQSDIEKRVRRQLRLLTCEEAAFIEGVKVKRTDAPSKQSYNVNGDKGSSKNEYLKRYEFEAAVSRILELNRKRERRKRA